MNWDLGLKDRHTALLTLDMDYARSLMPEATGDDVRLAAMHKARHASSAMPMALREESAEWLRTQGMTGLNGLPLDCFE
jgi:hypothetical protein